MSPFRLFEYMSAAGAGAFVDFFFVLAGAVLLLLGMNVIKPAMDAKKQAEIKRAAELGVKVVHETPRGK